MLEIGTGSGYQSAYLSNLTDKVWTIEIIKPLAERTRGTYDELIAAGYTEYKAITSKNADGYYGWAENGALRQDHRHLRHRPCAAAAAPAAEGRRHHGDPGRPAGRAACAEGDKTRPPTAPSPSRARDIFNKVVPFVPFTKLEGDAIKGNHNQ